MFCTYQSLDRRFFVEAKVRAMGRPSIGSDTPAWLQRKEEDFRKAMAEHGLAEQTISELMTQCSRWRSMPAALKSERTPKARRGSMESIAQHAGALIAAMDEMRASDLDRLARALLQASTDSARPDQHVTIFEAQIICMTLQEAANGLLEGANSPLGSGLGRSESESHKFVEALAVCALNPAGISTSARRTGAFMLVCEACFTLAGISSGARAAVEKYVQRTEREAGVSRD